jgi:L-threonylcarbamoyladenylate synthase
MVCAILPTSTYQDKESSLELAVTALKENNLVAFATETVYGLGANALSDEACIKIFQAKRRPTFHPLIVHIANQDAATLFARDIPPFAQMLMAAFWPGPLTLILPRVAQTARFCAGLEDVNASTDSDNPTIGLRCPAHPLALELLSRAAKIGISGVAAPSANRFGRVSPTTASHVLEEFENSSFPIAILDGGACRVGIESTIVDCSRLRPFLVRPGHITRSQIEEVIGIEVGINDANDSEGLRAPGTLASHYAPHAKVRIVHPSQMHSAPPAGVAYMTLPTKAHEAEQVLFAQLRSLDTPTTAEIWVSTPPKTEEWSGVRDRLFRAAF